MKASNRHAATSPHDASGSARPSRRGLLAAGLAGTAGVSALALWKRGLVARGLDESRLPEFYEPRVAGASSHLIPNLRVVTHAGERRLFYDDLVHDRVVTINFMSVRSDSVYPVIDNLVKVQRLLAERVGKDVFMISVTTDPEHDTPDVLAQFAKDKGVGPGWSFVSGGEREMSFLRSYLFARRPFLSATPIQGNHGPCCSVGMVRYGNERLCRWASFPAKVTPEFIALRFDWIGLRQGDAVRHA